MLVVSVPQDAGQSWTDEVQRDRTIMWSIWCAVPPLLEYQIADKQPVHIEELLESRSSPAALAFSQIALGYGVWIHLKGRLALSSLPQRIVKLFLGHY